MLSVQQLIMKALRGLQSSSGSATAGDLLQSLKHVAAAGYSPTISETTTISTTPAASNMPTTTTTTTINNVTSSVAAAAGVAQQQQLPEATLPKQQQQQQQEPQRQQEIIASNSSQNGVGCCETTNSSGSGSGDSDVPNNAYEIENASRNSNLNAGSSVWSSSEAEVWINSTAVTASTARGVQEQWQLVKSKLAINQSAGTPLAAYKLNSARGKTTTTPAVEAHSTPSTAAYLQRSQQIQNFYQQQLHHIHTQHNNSLYAKQKQTQFAMSSLAAAEPLVLQQEELLNGGGVATKATKAAATSCCENGNGAGNGSANAATTASATTSSSSSATTSQPCFSAGMGEMLQFMELIGNLKHTKRTGWVLRDVNDCESISGHMYRMSMMTFLLDGSEGLNQIRCMELALVHDLAESLVGDITPFCGITKTDKRAMEFKAMDDICKLIEPRGKRIMELFEEYEQGESAESKFVKDLDRLDMVMQAFEYEKRDNCLLKHQEFFDSTEGKFNHPFVKELVNEIYVQRKGLALAKGATPPPPIHVPSMDDTRATNGHCEHQQQQQEQLECQQKNSSTSS